MKKIANKHVTAALAAAALFVSGAAFTPGTAEAHCGAHQGSCGQSTTSAGGYCDGGDWIASYDVWNGYCLQADGPNAPCNGGYCRDGQAYGCWAYSYQQNEGINFEHCAN